VHGAPVPTSNDIIINTGTMNTVAETIDKQAIHYVGAKANSEIDAILGDLDSYNFNTSPTQYDEMLFQVRKKIADGKLRVQNGFDDLKLTAGKMDIDIKNKEMLQNEKRFFQEMERNEFTLSHEKDLSFEELQSLRQEREARNERSKIDNKKGEQQVKNLEQQGKTMKAEELTKRMKLYKMIGFTLISLGISGYLVYAFFNKPAAENLGKIIRNGAENTGTAVKTIIMGTDSTQQKQEIQPQPQPQQNQNKLNINPVRDSTSNPTPKPTDDDPLGIKH
jgi:hypothetical protein